MRFFFFFQLVLVVALSLQTGWAQEAKRQDSDADKSGDTVSLLDGDSLKQFQGL